MGKGTLLLTLALSLRGFAPHGGEGTGRLVCRIEGEKTSSLAPLVVRGREDTAVESEHR